MAKIVKAIAPIALQVTAVVVGAAVTAGTGNPILGALVGAAIAGAGSFALSALNKPASPSQVGMVNPQAVPGAAPVPTAAAKPEAAQARDRQQVIRSSVTPHRLLYGRMKVAGQLDFATFTGSEKEFLHLVVSFVGRQVDAIEEVWLDDVRSDDERFSPPDASGTPVPHVRVKTWTGAPDQLADPDLMAEVPQWTSEHRGRGVAYVYVRLKWNPDVFPNGMPNVTAVIRGHRLYDPRNATTAWSTNWALAVLDYLRLPAVDGGLGAQDSEIDFPSFIAAANASDEKVQITGGFQSRYTVDGTVELDANPADVLDSLLTAGVGDLSFTGGKFRLFAGVAQTPIFHLTAQHLRGPVSVRAKAPRAELFNAVRGTYVSPDNSWQPSDFTPQVNALYETQDGGERVYRDIILPFTSNHIRAQRIAKIHLEASRQGIQVDFPAKPMALSLAVGNWVELTLDEFGFSRKHFRVIDYKLGADLGVDLALREAAAAIYDWNFGQATTIDPAPDSNLPDPFRVDAPSSLALESGDSQLQVAGDGTVISRIRAGWSRAPDSFAAGYEVEYKLSADTAWKTFRLGPGQTEYFIFPVKDGDQYDVRVRAISVIGVYSPYVLVSNHTVIGKTSPPPDVETFTVARGADGTRVFRWTMATTPADVRVGGGFEIRWSPDPDAVWSAMTPLHTGVVIASPFESNELGAGTYTFGIKAVDSSGNRSVNERRITAVLGDPRLRSVLLARYDHVLGWPGTKTDCFVDDDGSLKAISTGTWDDLDTLSWDDLGDATWDTMLPNASPMIYETPVIDLGNDVYVTPIVSSSGLGAATYRMKTGLTADGGLVGSYGALGGVRCRYIKIETQVAGSNPILTTLGILLDGETVVEQWIGINTASYSEAGIFERVGAGHIKVKTRGGMSAIVQAQLAFINVGGVRTWEIVSKTATVFGLGPAVEIKLRDAAGTLVDAVIDLELRGPKVA